MLSGGQYSWMWCPDVLTVMRLIRVVKQVTMTYRECSFPCFRNSVEKPNAITRSRHSDTVSIKESWCANSQVRTALRTCMICSSSGTFSSDTCMKLANWQSGFLPMSWQCSWCWASKGSIEWSVCGISSFGCSWEMSEKRSSSVSFVPYSVNDIFVKPFETLNPKP